MAVDLSLDSILWELFWVILALILGYILGLFNTKSRIIFRNFMFKIFNRSIKCKLSLKTYYPKINGQFNKDLLDKIKVECEKYKIQLVNLDPQSLAIHSEILNKDFYVFLETDNNGANNDPESDEEDNEDVKYSIRINLDEFDLSYHSLANMDDYLFIIFKINESVKGTCFEGIKEINHFYLCDVIRNYTSIIGIETIYDKTYDAKISFVEKNLIFVFKRYEQIRWLIEKYIGY